MLFSLACMLSKIAPSCLTPLCLVPKYSSSADFIRSSFVGMMLRPVDCASTLTSRGWQSPGLCLGSAQWDGGNSRSVEPVHDSPSLADHAEGQFAAARTAKTAVI
ncbi:hypothetical protein CDQ92_19135 [Sphingopyxis bauzanensis]|uniref:Uncharacterized protein n=1 Tax=Sphingopyxis bauzanensis TaxID=651663 RepID=A0A246JJN9_9SPHN|nr:hypothetical protein CDQ92_19135 [Sphingopyxis bauzanensis]